MPIKTLIVLLGPTSVGKTEMCIELAESLHIPIINADSRQIYKGMSIGTAAPTLEQQKKICHYFVETLPLDCYYSAACYENQALAIINQLLTEHDVALLSGGSMLYLDAVCKGIDDIPTVDDTTRRLIKQRLEEEGLEVLRNELRVIDPKTYNRIDLKNPRRIVHALEIYYSTGQAYSSFLGQPKQQRPFRIIKIGLTRERKELFHLISTRTDKMMDMGLLEEARRLYPFRHLNALQTVGYTELFHYFDGEWTLDFAIEKIKRNTRVYAKKQMTWFKHDTDISWFHPDEKRKIWELLNQEGIFPLS